MQLVKFCRRDTREYVTFTPGAYAVEQIKRASGLVEDVCKCGVGHPNAECLNYIKEVVGEDHWGIHGCCGCCHTGEST